MRILISGLGVRRRKVAILFFGASCGLLLPSTAWSQDAQSGTSGVSHQGNPDTSAATERPSTHGAEGIEPALGGYCPVSYRYKSAATKGDPSFRSSFGGQVYYFADSEMKSQFDAEPVKFAPKYGGLCATALGGSYLKRKESDPSVFTIYQDRLYLFSSDRAKSIFIENPPYFVERADKFIVKPAFEGYCVVSYQAENKAVKGSPAERSFHKHHYYHFANRKNKELFDASPQKYIPMFEGFCTEGVSRGKRFPSDPTVFAVHEGRTYLFFDEAARKKFLADPETMAEAAVVQAPEALKERRPTTRPPFRDP